MSWICHSNTNDDKQMDNEYLLIRKGVVFSRKSKLYIKKCVWNEKYKQNDQKSRAVKILLAWLAGWFIGWVEEISLLVLSLSFQCYSWLELCFAKPPSFSCLTVNNYLAKLLDPESTKYTACTLCIPCLPTQTILFQNIHRGIWHKHCFPPNHLRLEDPFSDF